jgi:hypothetical protein
LEAAEPAGALAERLGLNPAALANLLDCLVALGLVEREPSGYRNLELASCYLTTGSPRSLKPALLDLAALADGPESLAEYARRGAAPPPEDAGLDERGADGHEALARLAAPKVVSRLEVGFRGPVLVLGWGGESYRHALAGRWPDLEITLRNPFRPSSGVSEQPPDGRRFGAIVVEGAISSCRAGQWEKVLEQAAGELEVGGLLLVHDRLLPAGASRAPETALESLGRQLRGSSSGAGPAERLSEFLKPLGFPQVRFDSVTAGSVLATAEKASP